MQFKLLTTVLAYASAVASAPIHTTQQAGGMELQSRSSHFGTETKRVEAYPPLGRPHFVEREALPDPEPQAAQAYDCPPMPNRVTKRGAVVQAYGCSSTPNRVAK